MTHRDQVGAVREQYRQRELYVRKSRGSFSWARMSVSNHHTELLSSDRRDLAALRSLITTTQTMDPNDVPSAIWQRPYPGYFGFPFSYSGRKWRCCCSAMICSPWLRASPGDYWLMMTAAYSKLTPVRELLTCAKQMGENQSKDRGWETQPPPPPPPPCQSFLKVPFINPETLRL